MFWFSVDFFFLNILLGKDSKNGIAEFCLFLVFRGSSQSTTNGDSEGKNKYGEYQIAFIRVFRSLFQK